MDSLSIQKNAGDRLDQKAKRYAQAHGVSYRDALYAVVRSESGDSKRYMYGENMVPVVESDQPMLTPAQREMAALVADPGRTQVLAGVAIDRLVQAKMKNKRTTDPVGEYRRALSECKRDYPNLARAAQDGFLGDTDYATLGLLVPAVAGEVEKGNYSRAERCSCGETRAYCRGKKLARRRNIDEASEEFSRCILDAQKYGTELDQVACYF
jgi:hypothetical protein